MEQLKKDYFRKIFKASLSNKDYSTVVINASFSLDDVKNILEELKDEFKIKNLIIADFDYYKMKSIYDIKAPAKDYIPRFPKPLGEVKSIYFTNDSTDLSEEKNEYYYEYLDDLERYNKNLFRRIDNLSPIDETITICPNREWAKMLYGSVDKLDDLWLKASEILLESENNKQELKKRVKIKNKLNKLGIKNLNFYTDLGTDFRISLNPTSIWVCEPNDLDSNSYYYNLPSYEIFTSPNCYSAEGKIVLSKKVRFTENEIIENAIFNFSKGKLIKCDTNSELFEKTILNKKNKLNRIGEIALVPKNTPLAKTKEYYDSLLLDENTGCHFALGDSIDSCIAIPKEKLQKKGKKFYRYNTSDDHYDLIFGNDSIVVEAETKSKQKVLLMEKGKWKI